MHLFLFIIIIIIISTAPDLPVQLTPSAMNPGRQVHVKVPGLLVQLARGLQPPLFSAHSSTSESSQTTQICYYYYHNHYRIHVTNLIIWIAFHNFK